MAVKVKICGVTNVADARAALASGADAIGLNFYSKSPRAVTVDGAREIVQGLPGEVCLVGVFVNEARARVAQIAGELGLSAVQFHGAESPEDCLGWGELKVIKALPAEGREDLVGLAARYSQAYLLVDAPSAAHGGSGCTFDWSWAATLPRERLVVAGGLTAANVADAVRALRPLAVDVASGVEVSPGRKDHGKLEAFIGAAKAA
jgi:phosphoribosylanthranilate isomerase